MLLKVKGCDYNNWGKGKGNFRESGHGNNYNQEVATILDHLIKENNFGFASQGRGKVNYYQERTNFNNFHCGKFGHKAVDCKFRPINQNNFDTQANVTKN